MPSDILGLNIFDQRQSRFEFKPGPIFSPFVLADEINRSTPKTQSALLEAMNELQVTIDGRAHALPEPFMVLATQNPVEHHGTFPLPEAQLDRFLMRLRIGYPEAQDEKRILREQDLEARVRELSPALDCAQVLELQRRSDRVRVDESLLDYVIRVAAASRSWDGVRLGLSPRGSLAWTRAARAFALTEGRDFCEPEDFKLTAGPVLAHRLSLESSLQGLARLEESEYTVRRILATVPAP
jgi:MoxR-like ATPase